MAKSKNSKKETSKNKIDKQQQRKAITGLLFVVIAILLGIAFISFMFSWQAVYCQNLQIEMHNLKIY